MAFENLKAVRRAAADRPSRLALSLLVAQTSHRNLRPFVQPVLRMLSRDGQVLVRVRKNGKTAAAYIRLADVNCDLLAVYEHLTGECYDLPASLSPGWVIDAGGNIGLFTLAASTRWPHARFVICEPLPRNVLQIRRNLEVNGVAAEIKSCAVGGRRGTMPFVLDDSMRGHLAAEPAAAGPSLEVKVETLSDIFTETVKNKTVGLIKLDIEGAEIEVLAEFLKRPPDHCFICGELHHWKETKETLLAIFREAHYRWRFFSEDPVCVLFHAWPNSWPENLP